MKAELYRKLNKAAEVDNKIKRIDIQISELNTMLEPKAIRYDKDKIQTSPSNDILGDVLAKIDILERDRNKLFKERIKAMDEVSKLIDKIDDSKGRLVLTYRYISNISLTEVSGRMGYSKEWCYQKHREAVKKLEQYI